MGVVGVRCVRGFVGLEEHKRCALDPLHPCGFTPDILQAMTMPSMERVESGVRFSPSSLLSCDRQDVLMRRDNAEWYVDVDGMAWYQQRGHMAHAYAETLQPWPGTIGVVREVRLSTEIDTKYGPQRFMGKSDAVVLNSVERLSEVVDTDGVAQVSVVSAPRTIMHVTIIDYKSKGEIGHGPVLGEGTASAERKHQMQVNLYAYLVTRELPAYLASIGMTGIDEVVVDELIIEYLDFKKARRFTSAGPLVTRGKRIKMSPLTYEELVLEPIFVMSHGARERWIRKHIEMRLDGEQNLPEPLSGAAAEKACHFCPVRQLCVNVGEQEGYDMHDQIL